MAGYDFKEGEARVLEFWNKNQIYHLAKEKNKDKKPFYFLDGPPYTSGKVHIGTAWNKTLKDMVLRYKRMRGFDVWDRAGYDMHGLPTEHATQKELKLNSKEEIESFGVEKFITACKDLCVKNMAVMNEAFVRLGIWMDFDGAYQSIDEEFIEGEWWLIKRAHEKNRLYEGLKTMTWCPSCASALAKHECEYKEVTENSIFVKFPVEGEESTYLIIWTTTPWTIPFNLAVMVNPELKYQTCKVKVKVKEGNEEKERVERWILSKALAGPVILSVANATYEVEEEYLGKKLEGLRYLHPFRKELPFEEMRLKHPKIHTVILSKEYVDTTAGSGLVHCAPGCGPEDYEVGVKNGLPPYNLLDEQGRFTAESGQFEGKIAKKDDQFFIEELKRRSALVATVPVEHDYAHCWRCKSPVVFRATRQWFFKVEDLKDRLIEENDKITWVPKSAYNAFDSWLRNLRDNSITKQRYWGTPVPIWKCDSCENYVVIGDREELTNHAGKGHVPKDLHKPWIDNVTWPCTQNGCNGTMKRVPDILDVWVDAGTVSWNCLNYPKNEHPFKELFPPEFILEGKDQIRGWFNLLHLSSMIAFNRGAFKRVYMHGFINDSKGRKMSKSLGNYILPEEVIEKYGANTFRYYAIGSANPGLDMNYNPEDIELKHRNLLVFWNLHNLLLDLVHQGVTLKEKSAKEFSIEDRYLLSRLNSTIKTVTEMFENYRLNEVPLLIESLLLDMSRTYIQLIRERLSMGTLSEKETILSVAFNTYIEAIKMFAVVAPIFSEQIYLDMKEEFSLAEKSIHLYDWPEYDETMIDEKLERDFLLVSDLIGAILSARDCAHLGVRWPSSEVVVESVDKDLLNALNNMEELVKQQTNVKSIRVEEFNDSKYAVEPNYRNLGKRLGQDTAKAVEFLKSHADQIGALVKKSRGQGAIEIEGFSFKQDDLVVTRKATEGWSIGNFSKGTIFLKTELTPMLEAEGFARELVRRVQQLRKEAKLEKNDKILLLIDAPELKSTLQSFEKEILTRTSAKRFVPTENWKEMTHRTELKIKGKVIRLGLKLNNK